MFDDPVSNSSFLTDSLAPGDSTRPNGIDSGSSMTETMVSDLSSQNDTKSLLEELRLDSIASSRGESISAERVFDTDEFGTLMTKNSSAESTFSSTLRKKNRCLRTPTLPVSTIRLSSFGIEKSCPVPKDEIYASTSGASEIYSSGSNHVEDIYSLISASCQEMRTKSDDTIENGVDSRTSLVKQSLMIRRSKGNPSYAKKVTIPIVPHLPKVSDFETSHLNRLNRNSTNPPVSPHRINNFVCESSPNRFIFDFGDPRADQDEPSNCCPEKPSIMNTSTTSLNPYQNALVAKMKETKLNLQRTISGTMTRRKKHKSGSATLPATAVPPSSWTNSSSNLTRKTSSMLSIERDSIQESSNEPVAESIRSPDIKKFQVFHPLPQCITRPSVAPPPPPPSAVSKNSATTTKNLALRESPLQTGLEEFKIDLKTYTDSIPKTGFDFLDNW